MDNLANLDKQAFLSKHLVTYTWAWLENCKLLQKHFHNFRWVVITTVVNNNVNVPNAPSYKTNDDCAVSVVEDDDNKSQVDASNKMEDWGEN